MLAHFIREKLTKKSQANDALWETATQIYLLITKLPWYSLFFVHCGLNQIFFYSYVFLNQRNFVFRVCFFLLMTFQSSFPAVLCGEGCWTAWKQTLKPCNTISRRAVESIEHRKQLLTLNSYVRHLGWGNGVSGSHGTDRSKCQNATCQSAAGSY